MSGSEIGVREWSARYIGQAESALILGLDLVTASAGAIAKLRELILLLAVQGKLVLQSPEDEPAGLALGRMQTMRARLIADGKIKRDKTGAGLVQWDATFSLPPGWEWARLNQLTSVLNGRAYAKQELLDSGTPVLRVGNLFTSKHWYYSNLSLDEGKYCAAGDLLFAWSASFGPFIWAGPKAIYHYHIWKLALLSEADLDKNYLYTFLLKKTQEMKAAGHGVSMVHMTKEAMEKIVVPVPPLAEQGRIVARVDELMKLCDALEQNGRLADEQHARLTATLFDALAASGSAQALAENWKRVAEHFNLLLDRPEAIEALERTILQLAVRGLLVPQDANDEPASVLRARIHGERAGLFASGLAKREKPLKPIDQGEHAFLLPANWSWVRFDEMVRADKPIAYGVLVPGPDTPGGIPLVRLADLSLDRPAQQPEKSIAADVDAQFSRTRLEGGEILLGVVGSIGKLGVAPDAWKGANIARAVCRIVPTSLVDRCYVLNLLQSDFMKTRFSGDTRTLAQPTLNVGLIRECPTPLPPLAEQHRIVARVEELRRLCAQLRERLTEARRTQSQLAGALVAEVAA